MFVEVRLRRARRFRRRGREHHGGQARADGRRGGLLSRGTRRARRRAASTRSCWMRSIPRASNGCATSSRPDRCPPSSNGRGGESCYNPPVALTPGSWIPSNASARISPTARSSSRTRPKRSRRPSRARRTVLTECLLADGKILACGNGGSACRRAALRGRDGRPLRARAAGTSGDLARHRHVDPHRGRQRLFVRADLREAGARARRQGRRAARHLDVRQFGQRDRRDRGGARARDARRRADRPGGGRIGATAAASATSICAFRTSAPRASRRSTC